MTIGSICQREVDLAQLDEPVNSAAQRMAARNVGMLAVVDERRRPVGLLTDRDLALRVLGAGRDPFDTLVKDVMTEYPETVSEVTSIEEALARMRELGVRRLPVVSSNHGELVGVVALDDILGQLVNEFKDVGGLLQKSSPKGTVEV